MATLQCLRTRGSSVRGMGKALSPKVGSLMCRRWKSGPYGYTQAKALVYSSYGEPNDVLSLHTHSISPSLPSNSILLRALSTPINPADINQIQGTYPSRPHFTSLLGTPLPSAVAGNEGCFLVQSIGSSISSASKGDWVIMRNTSFGTWRTHALAEEKDIIRIEKEGLTATQVGTVAVNPVTAWRMLKDFGGLEEGDWFVQNGANSGVGRAAIQLGREWGLRSLNIIRSRETTEQTEKLKEELVGLGANVVVTEEELMEKGFRNKVKFWTRGGREKVRLGLNCVGGKPTQAMVKCLEGGGHLVTYGGMSKQPIVVPTGGLIFNDIKYSGFWVSRWSDRHPEEKKETVDGVLKLIREGKFKDVPLKECKWDWDTEVETLKGAVQGTLEGFRSGKGIFVFGET